jgi:hypothetical protein
MSKYQINAVQQQKELDSSGSQKRENYNDITIQMSSGPCMADSCTVLLPLIASFDTVSSHFVLPVRSSTFGLDPNKKALPVTSILVRPFI